MKRHAPNQATLFDSPPGVGAYGQPVEAPHNGTPTSQAAAKSIAPVMPSLRRTVLGAIVAAVERGRTAEEIEDGTGLGGSTVRPRVVELREAGLIEDSGETRATRSGRRAVAWVATGAGFRWWRDHGRDA